MTDFHSAGERRLFDNERSRRRICLGHPVPLWRSVSQRTGAAIVVPQTGYQAKGVASGVEKRLSVLGGQEWPDLCWKSRPLLEKLAEKILLPIRSQLGLRIRSITSAEPTAAARAEPVAS